MDIKIISCSKEIKDVVFQKIFRLAKENSMRFHSCLMLSESYMIVILKDPGETLSISKGNNSAYLFEFKNNKGLSIFSSLCDNELQAVKQVELMRKRQFL